MKTNFLENLQPRIAWLLPGLPCSSLLLVASRCSSLLLVASSPVCDSSLSVVTWNELWAETFRRTFLPPARECSFPREETLIVEWPSLRSIHSQHVSGPFSSLSHSLSLLSLTCLLFLPIGEESRWINNEHWIETLLESLYRQWRYQLPLRCLKSSQPHVAQFLLLFFCENREKVTISFFTHSSLNHNELSYTKVTFYSLS